MDVKEYTPETVRDWIETKSYQNIMEIGDELNPVDLAELIREVPVTQLIEVLSLLNESKKVAVFANLPVTKQLEVFRELPRREFAKIFSLMRSDERVDLYQELTRSEQTSLLPFLDNKTKTDILHLNSYPPESAGGIMSSDFFFVYENMLVSQAIEKIRQNPPAKKLLYYIYVTSEDMELLGFVTFKDLLISDPSTPISSLVHREFISAKVLEDQEVVVKRMEDYDLVTIPVINESNQIVGIIEHGAAINTLRKEQTEDLEKFMGITVDSKEKSYLETSSFSHFKKRITWIATLAAVGIISGMIVHRFEKALETLIILALYMPMVADTGGNSGSQAATVVVRSLALDEISIRDWFKVLFKEFKVSILIALCLGVLAFGKILFLSYETSIPEGFSLGKIAVVISFALAAQVVTATVIGAGLPLLVKAFKGDPAVAASPLITTVVDIRGLLIYFGCAKLFLNI